MNDLSWPKCKNIIGENVLGIILIEVRIFLREGK